MKQRSYHAAAAARRERMFRAAIQVLVVALLLVGCASTPTPSVSSSPTAAAITKDEAIAIARVAVPKWADGTVQQVQIGRFDALGSVKAPIPGSSASPPSDLIVWVVDLGVFHGPLDASRTMVVIDAYTGAVLQTIDYVA